MIGIHLRRLWRSVVRWAAAGAAEDAPLALRDGIGPITGATSPPLNSRAVESRDIEKVDRLVRLTFKALLEREPDLDTLLAYRQGFANGTTFQGLVDDVLKSGEYAAIQERSRRLQAAMSARHEDGPWEAVDCDDPKAALVLLETRLVEMGCRLNLSPLEGAMDDTDPRHRRRTRSLLVTLSMLDRP